MKNILSVCFLSHKTTVGVCTGDMIFYCNSFEKPQSSLCGQCKVTKMIKKKKIPVILCLLQLTGIFLVYESLLLH